MRFSIFSYDSSTILIECKAKDISMPKSINGRIRKWIIWRKSTIPINTKNFSYKTRFVLWKFIGISMSACNV